MGRLDGKVAIITGATSGMGKASAELFAQEGAKVVFVDIKGEGKVMEAEIRSKNGEATYVQADVTKLEDCERIIKTTVETYGGIDVFYGNAGISTFYNLHEMDIEKDYDAVMNVNCKANFVLTKLVLPYMIDRGKGSLIYTLSVNAEFGMSNGAVYSASKGAVKQLIKSVAMEYGGRGIRANGILPGLILTGMTVAGGPIERALKPYIPLERAGFPIDIARAALYFASDESAYCSGSLLAVDGAQTSGIRPDISDAEH